MKYLMTVALVAAMSKILSAEAADAPRPSGLDAVTRICMEDHKLTLQGDAAKTWPLMSARLRREAGALPTKEEAKMMAEMTPPALTLTDRRVAADGKRAAGYGEGPPAAMGFAMSSGNSPAKRPDKMYYRCKLVLEDGSWKLDGSEWNNRPFPKLRQAGATPQEVYAALHPLMMGYEKEEIGEYLTPDFRRWVVNTLAVDELEVGRALTKVTPHMAQQYTVVNEKPGPGGKSATLQLSGATEAGEKVLGVAELKQDDGEWGVASVTWDGKVFTSKTEGKL